MDVGRSEDGDDPNVPVILIPDDVYWPWCFIPKGLDAHTNVKDSKCQVNWLCKECVVLRNSIVSSRFWGDGEEPISEAAEKNELFEHHADTHAMMQSAHGGCHLCSLLVATRSWTNMEEFPIMRYKVALFDRSKELSAPSPRNQVYLEVRTGGDLGHYYCEVVRMTDPVIHPFTYSKSSASERTRNWVKDKLIHCETSHVSCRRRLRAPGSSFLPSRLLDIRKANPSGIVSLVSSRYLKADSSRYIALSYFWGNLQPFKLLRSTMSQLQAGLALSALPKTIRDAIEISTWLNISYIWIDALCIIQDDPNDWNTEATTMKDVYSNSFLTIAAQGAKSSAEGCFAERNGLMHIPCELSLPTDEELGIFVQPVAGWYERGKMQMLYDNSFCNRVWTFQERFLSSRLLYFAAGVEWQCDEHFDSDIGGKYERKDFEEGIDSFKRAINTIRRDGTDFDLHMLRYHWANIATTYTQLNVTISDRAIALQGVIQYVQEKTGYENVAGLWRPILLSELLWFSLDMLDIKHKPTSVPSWSWLVRNGVIWYQFIEPHTKFFFESEVIYAQARFLSIEAGSRWIGEIHIEGLLVPVACDGERRVQLSAIATEGLEIGEFPALEFDYDVPFDEMELFLLPIANVCTDFEIYTYLSLVLSLSGTSDGAYERQGHYGFSSKREEYKEKMTAISKVQFSELEKQIIILV